MIASPKFRKWRNKSFEHFDQLDALCSRSTATGSLARDNKKKSNEKDAHKRAGGNADEEEEEEEEDDDDDDDDDDDEGGDEDKDDEQSKHGSDSGDRKRASAVGATDKIAAALDGLAQSSEDSLSAALEDLLERDGDAFDVDELSQLGMAMADMPSRYAVYKSFRHREDLRRSFLRKLLDIC
ncbi:hypothetical protein OC842_001901 [Tilletia horrida]|uniref:Uncharacterized protein n=1 Tax=Tilletia horrida TaxID=155126 RepID=A0AAN6JLU8_9BASI|nr:hypothetical protein OC842_001901 [Tilletia horrida]